MASPAKFSFDLDLSGKKPVDNGDRLMSEAAIAALIQNAKQEGYAEGFVEGERGMVATQAQGLAFAAQALAARGENMLAGLEEAQKQAVVEAVNVAMAIGRKLASNLISREPLAELEVLINECFASLEGVPHLVIRCHPDLADQVREIATTRIATAGFSGRLVVMGDPDQALGDGRIEWVDGGLVRNSAAISEEIDNRITAYLAARGAISADVTEL
jgi:flagellar assembly protein FliH